MSDISVKFKDHVHARIDTDPGIMQELSEYFTFDQPGARFMPQFKAKLWDGKVRLYNMFTRELYVGLVPYVTSFAETMQYTIDLSEYKKCYEEERYDRETTLEYVKSLNLYGHGKPIEIRDYQVEAVDKGINDLRTLLLSPTGSGKSLIIYSLVRYHLKHNRPQLILVPTTSLVEQLYADFQDYSSANGWKTSDYVHRIYAGHDKSLNYPVVISTWQSLYKLPKQFFSRFEVVYGDEAHLFKAKSLTSILNKMPQCRRRIGTTGTLDGTQTHKLVLEGLFGPVHRVTTTKSLIKNKQLADLDISCIILEHKEEHRKLARAFTYHDEMDFLTQHDKRNTFIRNLSLKQTGNTLVLFQFVEKHGKALFEDIKLKARQDRKVFFVHGNTDTQDREEVRRITETEKDAIIVASFGTFSTGINIRNLHNVIFASPSKSRIRNLQSIGRGLRTSDTKDRCKLYDIGDDLSWKTKKNFTLLHMAERIKIYNDEHFDYKIIKVPL